MLFSFGELREIRCSEGLTVFIKKKFTITRVVKPYGIFQVRNALVKTKGFVSLYLDVQRTLSTTDCLSRLHRIRTE